MAYKVTVLFCQKNSIYKRMGCNVYDEDRNSLSWMGSEPAIYHPPCRLWSKLKHLSTADPIEKYLALWAVNKVRSYGGILEHPAYSSLFNFMNLPKPGNTDEYGFTIEIDQFNYGHLARKKTWLYICGADRIKTTTILSKKINARCKYQVSGMRHGFGGKPKVKDPSGTPRIMARTFVKIIQEINNSKSSSTLHK
jgi:hypothetical protein